MNEMREVLGNEDFSRLQVIHVDDPGARRILGLTGFESDGAEESRFARLVVGFSDEIEPEAAQSGPLTFEELLDEIQQEEAAEWVAVAQLVESRFLACLNKAGGAHRMQRRERWDDEEVAVAV